MINMAISSDKKRDLLLQSFDVLKNNLDDNSDKIKEIIGKMAKIDPSISVEMWTFSLDNGESLVRDDPYSLCGGTIYELEENIGKTAVVEILKENSFLTDVVFGKSGDICTSTIVAITDSMQNGEIELSERMLNLVYKNRNKEQSFGEILEEICEYAFLEDDEDMHVEIVPLLMSWSEKVTDKERKARITVNLLDYI